MWKISSTHRSTALHLALESFARRVKQQPKTLWKWTHENHNIPVEELLHNLFYKCLWNSIGAIFFMLVVLFTFIIIIIIAVFNLKRNRDPKQ